MVNVMTRDRIVHTDYDNYHLCYHIHRMKEKEKEYFGVSISQYSEGIEKETLFDQAMIKAFSENYHETEAFFDTIVEEIVFPVHLYSIADDWYESMTS